MNIRAKSTLASTILLVALGVSGAACGKKSDLAQPKPPFTATAEAVNVGEGATPLEFVTAEATLGAPMPLPPVTARVVTVETKTSPTVAPLSGRVVQASVRLGDHVKAGDRLIEVRTADLPTLQHDLRAAELAIKTKKAIVERLEQLVEARAASKNELVVAQSELDEAKLAASAAAERIKSLTIQQSGSTSYWVLANRSGTVVQLDAAPGKQVGPEGDKPIATIADLGELLVIADVSQKDAAMLAPGAPVEIRFADGVDTGATGTIESVSDVVDPDKQTVPVRVHVDNEKKLLRPNAFVNVVFSPSIGQKIVGVPAAAVVSDGAESVVFVEGEPKSFRRRRVEVGRRSRIVRRSSRACAPASAW